MTTEHEPTQAEIDAFTQAWDAKRQEIGRGIAPKGTKTRAGLTAANAIRDRRTQQATNRVVAAEIKALASHVQGRSADEILNAMHTRAEMLDTFSPFPEEQPSLLGEWQAVADKITADHKAEQARVIAELQKVADRLSRADDEGAARLVRARIAEISLAPSTTEDQRTKQPKAVGDFAAMTKGLTEIRNAFDHAADPASKRAEGLRTNALSLLALQDIDEGNAVLLREIVNALAGMATPAAEITDEEIYKERQHQISSGYSARHDDEHGLRHLLLWSIQYGKRGKAVQSLALIRAALESMTRKGQDL